MPNLTIFPVFTNSTPASLVLMVKKIMLQKFIFHYHIKRQNKTKNQNKNESSFKQINFIIAATILKGIIIEFYETHWFTEVYLS